MSPLVMMAFIVALSEGVVGKVFDVLQGKSQATWLPAAQFLASGVVGFVLSYFAGLNFFPFAFGQILTALIPVAGVALVEKFFSLPYDVAFYQGYIARQARTYFIEDEEAECCNFPCEDDLPKV